MHLKMCQKNKIKNTNKNFTTLRRCNSSIFVLKSIMKKRVFLGGTCNGSNWRDLVMNKLEIDYFNPVVEDWTPEVQAEEIKQRAECDFVLYVITPKMTGFYAIAEVVDDSNKRPEKTIFCYLNEDGGQTFSEVQIKSLKAVAALVKGNGATCLDSLADVIEFLNSKL